MHRVSYRTRISKLSDPLGGDVTFYKLPALSLSVIGFSFFFYIDAWILYPPNADTVKEKRKQGSTETDREGITYQLFCFQFWFILST